MNKSKILKMSSLALLLVLFSCGAPAEEESREAAAAVETIVVDSPPAAVEKTVVPAPAKVPDYDTAKWTDIVDIAPDVVLDLRYATTNNFVEEQMYDCGRCFLRPEVARAVKAIHEELKTKGYGLKFFDCYRPRPVQWELWEKVPNPQYVADPRKGSMHNRGAAVDLTIVTAEGEELDMGTEFDFFGKRAYHDFYDLPEEVLANRKLLKSTMAKYQFRSTRTEWWHYSYKPKSYELSDMLWQCE